MGSFRAEDSERARDFAAKKKRMKRGARVKKPSAGAVTRHPFAADPAELAKVLKGEVRSFVNALAEADRARLAAARAAFGAAAPAAR